MKQTKLFLFWLRLFSLLVMMGGFYVFLSGRDFTSSPTATDQVAKQPTEQETKDAPTATDLSLPEVSLDDWELLLVNRENVLGELYPDLAAVGPVYVDSRIAEATLQFLTAAQAIDLNMHLISGYRSVADQEVIYNSYVQQEMMVQGLSYEVAVQVVQTYSQPAGASEHQTGLAIDLSNVDALNQADPAVMQRVQELAPDYGFVLRFPEGKEQVTGIGYEDWHFRYVGVESAKYMTEKQLTLEEYIEEIRRQS